MLVGRTWGDGYSRTGRKHVIASISYPRDGGRCALQCGIDGTLLIAPTPAALVREWQAHGGKAFVAPFEDRDQEPEPSGYERGQAAMVAIYLHGQECTCTSDSDITLCPNYVEGDELEIDDDE